MPNGKPIPLNPYPKFAMNGMQQGSTRQTRGCSPPPPPIIPVSRPSFSRGSPGYAKIAWGTAIYTERSNNSIENVMTPPWFMRDKTKNNTT